MNFPRSKKVMVGGREFTVRPLTTRAQRDLETDGTEYKTNTDRVVAICLAILRREAPDLTAEWLLDNSDQLELNDVMKAAREVVHGPEAPAPSGEVPAP